MFLDLRQMESFARDPLVIERADGIWYWDTNGRKIMDGISGIFVVTIGHNNRRVIDAAHAFTCAFKPNSAFYEARGLPGWEVLKQTIDYVHGRGLPVVLDAKRGDIASTAAALASFINGTARTSAVM